MNFYFEASKILDRLDAKQGSIKGIISNLPEKDRKRTAALVIETLKYKPVLTDVIDAAKLLRDERKITSMNLALVLVHDLLLSGGIQAGDGVIKQAILRHKTRLKAEFQKAKIKRGAKSNTDLVQEGDERAARIPRYVRVNTSLWTTEDASRWYLSQGFTLASPFESSKGFSRDAHIPDLLLFSPQMTFHEDDAYKSGKIILQDKASCFPATVLSPPSSDDSVVMDATAAPGNKTSHLSALMRNKGKLYAFERDKKRFLTLKTMLTKASCKNVESINADFLTIDPLDIKFFPVTHILLDPSCSGSGIVNRLDYLLETVEDEISNETRLNKLAAFQLMMVKHAMRFPKVQKIVYSTCSIHAIENEHVVRSALESDEAKFGNFVLAPQNEVLPTWHRRGLAEEMDGPESALSVIRCLPGEDNTNGFFVACFVKYCSKKRKESDDEDPSPSLAQASHKRKRRKKKH